MRSNMLKIIIAISLFMPWFSIGSMDMKYLEEQIDKFLMELENNPSNITFFFDEEFFAPPPPQT